MKANSKEPFYMKWAKVMLVIILVNMAIMALIYSLPVFITVTRPCQLSNDELYQIYRSTTSIAWWWNWMA